MSSIYPCDKSRRALFYVEFERGDREGEFTLFRRQWMRSESEMEILKKESPDEFPLIEMCNEVHPWNLFTANYGPDGCVPDRTWVCWMVDALNNQASLDSLVNDGLLKILKEKIEK